MPQFEPEKRPSTSSFRQRRGREAQGPDQATVRRLLSKLSQVPEVRQERVGALRLEIQTGQFRRSNDQVAGAIVGQLLNIHLNG